MRWSLIGLLVTITAAVAAATSEATTAPPVAYRANIGVLLHYQVDWSGKSGDPTGACSTWRTWHGSNSVVVSNVPDLDSLKPLRGSVLVWPSEREFAGQMNWAIFTAVGRVWLHIQRQLVQNGENCFDGVSSRWTPPSTDCGQRKVKTRATLQSSMRVFDGTLDASNTPDPDLVDLSRKAIDVWAAPATEPFKSCAGQGSVSSYLVNVGLPIDAAARNALRSLKPGRKLRLRFPDRAGSCTASIPRRECSFEIDGMIWITRDAKTG